MNKLPILLLTTAMLTIVVAPTASAHASRTIGDGSIKITWGFLDEPAYVGVKNRLDLIVRDNATNAGIGGLGAANFTTLELKLGDRTYALGNVSAYAGPKGAAAGPGNYTSNVHVHPTEEGIYALHVAGEIHGQAFDVTIPAQHEMEPLSEISFPEADDHDAAMDRIAQLEARIAALEAKAKTQAETPATVTEQATPKGPIPGAAVGLAALAVVGVALALRRRA